MLGTDQHLVCVSPTVEGDQGITQIFLKILPKRLRKNEKKGGLGEEGDDEGVHIGNTVVDVEALDEVFATVETGAGSGEREFPNIFKRDFGPDWDSQVCRFVAEAQGGPG